MLSRATEALVMSSCLCKKAEGAGFPFEVESVEDRIDDSVHARYVDKAHHGPGAASHFDKAALDDVGGAQLSPQMAGQAEEAQQLRQIALQLPHHGRVCFAPAFAEAAKFGLGLAAAVGQVDPLRVLFHFVIVPLANLLQDVAHLVYPATLVRGARIDGLDGRSQSRTPPVTTSNSLSPFSPRR